MMHMTLAALTMLLVTVGFSTIHDLNGIQSAYLGLYKGIVEDSVAVLGAEGGYARMPSIYLPKLRGDLKEYFAVNLSPYCREYRFSCVGYQAHYGKEIYIVGVGISFSAKINDLTTVEKRADFHIERSASWTTQND